MASSPIISRRRLGQELRRLRLVAGVSTEEAAAFIRCSQSKMSRLENGRGVPKYLEVKALPELYGEDARARAEELLRLAEEGERTRAWWNSYRDVIDGDSFPEHLRRLVAFEQDATTIWSYSPLAVSGLLQATSYMHLVIDTLNPGMAQRDRNRLVEFRTRRKKVLSRQDPPLSLSVIMCESVLLRCLPHRNVMHEQFRGLLAAIETGSPELEIRVVPLATGVHRGLTPPFSVFGFADESDDGVVCLEGAEGVVYLETRETVARYLSIFAEIEGVALDAAESAILIRELMQEKSQSGR